MEELKEARLLGWRPRRARRTKLHRKWTYTTLRDGIGAGGEGAACPNCTLKRLLLRLCLLSSPTSGPVNPYRPLSAAASSLFEASDSGCAKN